MRRFGLALVVVGFLFIVGQGIVTFLIPLVAPVFPDTPPNMIANALGIGWILFGFFLVILGIIIFLIYRHKR